MRISFQELSKEVSIKLAHEFERLGIQAKKNIVARFTAIYCLKFEIIK